MKRSFEEFIIGRWPPQGGMATVVLARDPSLGREVTLKIFASRFQADPAFLQRFINEVLISLTQRGG